MNLLTLSELWRQEQAAVERRFAEERANAPLSVRVERGLAISEVEIEETAAAPGDRTLLWLRPRRSEHLDLFRAGTGAPVRLWWDGAEEQDTVEGVLSRRRRDAIGVVVSQTPPDRLFDGMFHVDLEAPRTTFRRGESAIKAFAGARAGSDLAVLREILFGQRLPKTGHPEPWTPLDDALTAPQLDAVAQALAAQELMLIHGPPGTGKTRTLVEIVRQAVQRDQRVLVTAASNAAVDNLAERLIDAGVELVRLGHPARVAPAVEARSLDALLEATPDHTYARRWMDEANAMRRRLEARQSRGQLDRAERRETYAEIRRLMGDARHHLRRVQEAIVAHARVICATAVGADVALLDRQTFDVVVLDEATQAPDPIALVPLSRGRTIIMAGDPHQLPPTVIDLAAERAGLGRTIFERLTQQAAMLTVQHRMHAHLMAFPSLSKYDGRLIAAESVAAHTLEDLGVLPDPLRPGPLVFIDTAGKGWEDTRTADDPSTFNPSQAERTAAEARRLLSRGLKPEHLAIITPYDAQARRLRDLLRDVDDLEIDTVDGFQGREKEAVIVDLVRSNTDAELGFLRDTRRMNVALTRARRFLLVIGDSALLATHPYYAEFLESAEAYGTWTSAWTDDAEPVY
jgi:ATP-dependent RNA/DNA helicase IGHMBP2